MIVEPQLLVALVLGLVQGLTEFLPISSSAHLYAIPYLFGVQDPLLASLAFGAILHLGTLAAVLFALRRDVGRLVALALGFVFSAGRRRGAPDDERLAVAILLGTVPAVIVGLAFGDLLDSETFRTPFVVGAAVTAGALLLLVAEVRSKRERPESSVGIIDGIVMGMAQALALIPGISRSGATISAGLFLGFRRDAAARLGFLLGIPAIAGAGALELRHVLAAGGDLGAIAPALIIGVVTSFFSGLIALRLLLALLSGRSTRVFVAYRLLFAAVLIGTAIARGGA
jgi:undecaprenyl-diphosphatase